MLEEILNKLFNDSIIEDINQAEYTTIFKLPIELCDAKIAISKNIITDLELCNDADRERVSLYGNIFNKETLFGRTNLDMWSKYYTNDRDFLRDSQQLYREYRIQEYRPNESKTSDKDALLLEESPRSIDDETIYNLSTDIFHDEGFIDRFHYIDLPVFKDLNKNEAVLQIMAYQNLSSPAFALVMPVLMLMLPFFIIKIQGHEITFERYTDFIKQLLGNHILGQLFCGFADAPFEKKVYMIVSLGLFIFQIYSNINSCKNYYTNIKYVHDTLDTVRIFLTDSVTKIENYLKYSKDLITYRPFNDELADRREIIEEYLVSINKIGEYRFDIKKILELGYLMKCFYILNNDNRLTETIKWCFGFTGYIENISRLQIELREGRMNFCNFITDSGDKDVKQDKKMKGANAKKQNIILRDCYFAGLNGKNPVTNTVRLENNIIITGPNAAGKTTLLKSVLYNIIISQQIGCGFYSKADLKLYDFIHCYINIPDTGDRDSLFQAECRTCRDILTTIMDNPDKNHFCVFDELYSGTNPYEAIASGYSYLDYVSRFSNINFVLTTHYIGLCSLLESKINKNYYMEIVPSQSKAIRDISNNNTSVNNDISDNSIENENSYTYTMVAGISKVKGGIKVLKDLSYPEQIVKNMKQTMEKISF